MKIVLNWLSDDQRSAVAAGMLVLVMQVIIMGSLIQDYTVPVSIL